MSRRQKIGYLVPQFPGQTHVFFWREIAALEAMGVEPVLFSTRPPPAGLIAHDWSQAAMARTSYLGQLTPGAAAGRCRGCPGANCSARRAATAPRC